MSPRNSQPESVGIYPRQRFKRSKFVNDREEVQNLADAVALKCLDCSCWSKTEVESCFDNDCPLYPWRLAGITTRSQIDILQAKREKPSENIKEFEGNLQT